MGAEIGTGLLVGAGSGLVSSVVNGLFADKANKDSFYNNVKLWQMNNEYNTPLQQMNRLEEAGLNPNLVYGNGSVVGNTSSQPSAPSLQVPKFNLDMTNLLLGQNLKKAQEEIKAMQTRNAILSEQLKGLKYDNNLFLGTGLPRNSPWYAKTAMEIISNPKIVNTLKSLGYSIGDVLYDIINIDNGASNNDGFDPNIPLTNSGKVDIKYLD